MAKPRPPQEELRELASRLEQSALSKNYVHDIKMANAYADMLDKPRPKSWRLSQAILDGIEYLIVDMQSHLDEVEK